MSETTPAPDLSFEMPSELATQGFAVRPRTPQDTDFLRELYISFRWAELEAAGWPEATRRSFLADQFRLQDNHYTTHYTTTAFLIITQNGAPVGRLYIDRGGVHEIRLVDIILVPMLTGRGIGSAIIRVLLDEAARTGRYVGLHVESYNPARRLYQRLGFVDRRLEGPYFYMSWGDFPADAGTVAGDGAQLNTI
ncbi:GNAT family N-acetyltransferase [Tistrella mobilis]|uniref:GNAT family N-acetyltransferase n=1 Tax=Tistrella mobilis TaxID=171437 RepID=UPI0031F65232